ncbi:MAG: hypothetical protein KC484_09000 [Colwelliaceae bacterium]|nr:hypothetical protein [Colwelliaceae bacterium]
MPNIFGFIASLNIKFIIFLFLAISLLAPFSLSANIYIHTDNIIDLKALKDNRGENNLSASTNLHALQKELSNIHFEYMTVKRSLQFMDEGKNICVVNKIKTKERLEKYIFSKPINLFLGRRLYQHSAYSPLSTMYSPDYQVNLLELFNERKNSQLLISGQISYGDILDEQIAALPNKNKITRQSSEHDSGIINMFSLGRAEFALLYPHRVFTFKSNLVARSFEIESIEPYALGHLMCTNNSETHALIDRVNEHLNSENSFNKLLEYHLNFINPNDKTIFEFYFHQVF